jgi:hypothetical protein
MVPRQLIFAYIWEGWKPRPEGAEPKLETPWWLNRGFGPLYLVMTEFTPDEMDLGDEISGALN